MKKTKKKLKKKFEQHTNKNIFFAFCQLINQISKILFSRSSTRFNSTLRFKSQSIQDFSRRKFNKEFKSFKFKIFAIDLNSTLEFQFQSIKSFVRRKFFKFKQIQANSSNFKFFKFNVFIIDFNKLDVDDIINQLIKF